MNDTQTKQSMARMRIETLQQRLSEPSLIDDSSLDAHRDMLAAAHASSNGSAENLAALSTTMSNIAVVLTQDRLREADRMRQIVTTVHKDICIFAKRPDIAKMLLESKADGETQETSDNDIDVNIVGLVKSKAHGKPAMLLAVAAAVFIVLGGVVAIAAWQKSLMDKAILKAADVAAQRAVEEVQQVRSK